MALRDSDRRSPPSAVERYVLRRAAAGEPADFESWDGEVEIDAGFVRRLLCLDTDVPFGLWVRHAKISGTLDLRDAHGPDGQPCPPLILEHCRLEGDPPYDDPAARRERSLDARHARLARVRLDHCRAGRIDLSGAVIEGDLDLDHLRSPVPRGQCWVVAQKVRVDGRISLKGSELRVAQEGDELPEEKVRDHALDLSTASIGRGLALFPGFSARGGVRLSNAHVAGDVWAAGAHLVAAGGEAMTLQGAHVEGNVALRSVERDGGAVDRFESRGSISLYGTRIEGTLDLSGARFLHEEPAAAAAGKALLGASFTHVVGGLVLGGRNGQFFEAEGLIQFWNTQVEGNATLGGVIDHLQVLQARFGSNLAVTPFDGRVELTGSEIAGDFTFTSLDGQLVTGPKEVGGNAVVSGRVLAPLMLQDARLHGSLTLDAAVVQGGGAYLGLPRGSLRTEMSSVRLARARAERDLVVQRLAPVPPSRWSGSPRVQRLRTRALACYPGWQLGEALVDAEGRATIVSWLSDERHVVMLNGMRAQLPRLNRIGVLDLATEEARRQYLRLWLATRWRVEAGARVVESRDDLPPRVAEEGLDLAPLSTEPATDGGWRAAATVLQQGVLARLSLTLSAEGHVEIAERTPIETYPAPCSWRPWGSVRVARGAKTPWPAESAFPEEGWQETDPSAARALLERVSKADTHAPADFGWLEADLLRIRWRRLSFYPKWRLAECWGVSPAGLDLLVSCLMRGSRVILLGGLSNPIHLLNRDGDLELTTDAQRCDYLRFFCGHIWGEEGSFTLVETADELPPGVDPATVPLRSVELLPEDAASTGGPWVTRGVVVHYGGHFFTADLKLMASGMVEMLSDQPLPIPPAPLAVDFSPPVRVVAPPAPSLPAGSREWPRSPVFRGLPWKDLGERKARKLFDRLREVGRLPAERLELDLERCRAGGFVVVPGADELRAVWPHLDGFEYEWIDPSRALEPQDQAQSNPFAAAPPVPVAGRSWKQLLVWLKRRYDGSDRRWRPTTYTPQPFEHLAAVLRKQGELEAARKVTVQRLRAERRERGTSWRERAWKLFTRPFSWLFDRFFLFGLSPPRALGTFLLCWLLGAASVLMALHLPPPESPVLVVEVDATAAVGGIEPSGSVGRIATPRGLAEPVACGEQIEPALYALDVFLPLVDLEQERRCSVDVGVEADVWRWLEAAYRLLGWIVTSLMVASWTGVFRRHFEG